MTPVVTSRSRLTAVAGVVLLAVAACSGGTSAADGDGSPTTATIEAEGISPSSEAGDVEGEAGDVEGEAGDVEGDAGGVEPEELDAGADLYAVPDPIPEDEHGTLLRYQEITPTQVEGSTTWRVMYLSESLEGESIVVTGTVLVPTAPAPAEGRMVVANAHGTTGIADECAPSQDGGDGALALMGPVLDDGWVVTSTDYEGLGTPGRHPYLVGESEGRSVIDSVRAAAQLPDAELSDRLAITGYSQGGHGALWAGEVAAEWAPELEVVGTFAGAPATEIDLILRAAPSLPQAGFAYMIVAGIAAAYPEADPALFLTDEGVARLDAVDEGCTGEIFAAVSGVPASDLVRAGGADVEPWKSLAAENNPGQVTTEAPILIVHSAQDDTVPVALSGILEGRMCGLGQVVERRVLPEGGSHGGAAPEAFRQGLAWLTGLVEGTEPVDGCAA